MRRFMTGICIIFMFTLIACQVLAQVTVPEKVRIGLYYGNLGIPVVNIKSQNGIDVGFYDKENFVLLYQNSSQNDILVRKDGYFVKNNGQYIEYKPNTQNIPSGERIGPYHVQIGSMYLDKTVLDKDIAEYRAKNLSVFPVYSEGWYIWTGLYVSLDEAQQAINTVLKPLLGENSYMVIQPSPQRIQIVAGEEIKLMFESQTNFLRIRSGSSVNPTVLNINGKNYRGEIEIRRYPDSDLTVINVLPLEEYLYGVVPREIGASSPIEAIKAQAVVARNYALKNLKKYSKWGFDMTDTVSDQAYGGYDWERPNSNKAIDETKGKVLMYNGKLASTFYFSTSGGKTEDVRNVWGSEGYPYLISVEDKYEPLNAPKAKWEVTLTAGQIKEKLKSQGYDLGEITTLQPLEFSEAGRVIKLLVKGTNGEKIFEKDKCRSFLGYGTLLSQWYRISTDSDVAMIDQSGIVKKTNIGVVKIKTVSGIISACDIGNKLLVKGANEIKEYSVIPTTYKFTGKGWGHGVGMSQMGAIGMANAGFTYDQILKWYFPGTYIEVIGN